MKTKQHLILHHLEKDIRYLKFPLFPWIILLVTSNLFFLILSRGGAEGTGGGAYVFFTLSFLLELVLIAVIIGLVIQNDSLVGSTASWFTRPISAKMLFISKMLFILIFFLGIPLVFDIVVMILQGVLAQHIFAAVMDLAIRKLAFIIPLMMAAIFTANYALYIFLGALPFFAAGILDFFYMIIGFLGYSYSYSTLQQSRSLVVCLLIIGLGLPIIFHQFISRKTIRSIIFTALGIIAVTVTSLTWKWDFLEKPVPVLHEKDPLVQDIFLFSDGSTNSSSHRDGYINYESVDVSMDCYGGPADRELILNSLTDIKMTTSDGKTLEVPIREITCKPFIDYFLRPRTLEYFFHPSIITPGASPSRAPYAYQEPRFNAEILRFPQKINIENPGTNEITYYANAAFDLIQYNTYAALPLKPGYKYKKGSESLQVLGIETEAGSGRWLVKVKFRSLNSWFAGINKKPAAHLAASLHILKLGFALHNKKKKEVFLAENVKVQPVTLYPFQIVFLKIGFPYFDMKDETWPGDVELVCFEAIKTARFSKPFVIQYLHIPGCLGESMDRKERRELLLEKITLPENPTVSRVRQYIGKILAIRFNLSDLDDEDLRTAKLAKVGPRCIHILAEMGNRFHKKSRYYAAQAMNRLAGHEHKELIVPLLNTYPELIDAVTRHGWIKDVREMILERLKQNPLEFPPAWINAAISFRDPGSYAALHTFFIYTDPGNLVKAYNRLKYLPGFDRSQVVASFMKRAKYKDPAAVVKIIPLALEEGYAEALEIALGLLKNSSMPDYYLGQLWQAILKFTRYRGEKQEIHEWFKKNKPFLVFDKNKRKFITRRE